ncbi:MAG: hypothetical protein K2X82_24310 [Gemmataceae bacterium]|nr:hypothetical protein [Gemmataceae bacterium]
MVRVEFYGLARLRAGVAGAAVEAATVADALAAACPGLAVVRAGRVAPEYLLSVGGGRFTTNPDDALAAGDTLLVLGADAGG